MGVYDELKARGMVAQVTNEEQVKDLLNNQKTAFYIGFDPTAPSLHAGGLIQIMMLHWFQATGHQPISLMGGGTGGPSQFVPMPTEGIKLLQGLYREPTFENLKKMLNVFVFDASTLTDDLIEARLNNMMSRKDHLENFVASLAANPKQFGDVGPRLGEITAPTLVIWGRDDRFVPMDCGLRLLWGMPNAELHIFNRCGHWAQWEHADKFNRMVLDFLAH